MDITGGGAPISEMSVIYHSAAGRDLLSFLKRTERKEIDGDL